MKKFIKKKLYSHIPVYGVLKQKLLHVTFTYDGSKKKYKKKNLTIKL
jgi:hypothetical protein